MKNIVIKGWMIAVAVFAVMFGGILFTIGTGDWSTTRDSEPARLTSGEFNPADIRGSYAFSEIEEFFGVPANFLFEAFLIPDNLRKPTFLVKNMEDLFAPVVIDGAEVEVGTDLVRMFTSLYVGIPYESAETTYMPVSAVAILMRENTLDAEQQVYWQAHTFELVAAGDEPAGDSPAGEMVVEEHTEDAFSIKGGTTIGEMLEQGLTAEQFQEITGVELPANRALGLRDFVTQNGLDMETIKTGLEERLVSGTTETTPVEITKPTEETAAPLETAAPSESETSVIDIKGSTSIADVLAAGLVPEQFTEITGVAVPEDTTMRLKDFVDANGLDMETVRTQILDTLAH